MIEKNQKALTEKLLEIWLYTSQKGDVTWREEQVNNFSIVSQGHLWDFTSKKLTDLTLRNKK